MYSDDTPERCSVCVDYSVIDEYAKQNSLQRLWELPLGASSGSVDCNRTSSINGADLLKYIQKLEVEFNDLPQASRPRFVVNPDNPGTFKDLLNRIQLILQQFAWTDERDAAFKKGRKPFEQAEENALMSSKGNLLDPSLVAAQQRLVDYDLTAPGRRVQIACGKVRDGIIAVLAETLYFDYVTRYTSEDTKDNVLIARLFFSWIVYSYTYDDKLWDQIKKGNAAQIDPAIVPLKLKILPRETFSSLLTGAEVCEEMSNLFYYMFNAIRKAPAQGSTIANPVRQAIVVGGFTRPAGLRNNPLVEKSDLGPHAWLAYPQLKDSYEKPQYKVIDITNASPNDPALPIRELWWRQSNRSFRLSHVPGRVELQFVEPPIAKDDLLSRLTVNTEISNFEMLGYIDTASVSARMTATSSMQVSFTNICRHQGVRFKAGKIDAPKSRLFMLAYSNKDLPKETVYSSPIIGSPGWKDFINVQPFQLSQPATTDEWRFAWTATIPTNNNDGFVGIYGITDQNRVPLKVGQEAVANANGARAKLLVWWKKTNELGDIQAS